MPAVASRGANTLVLLPGLDGTEVFFGPLLRALPSEIDVRVVTYPPTGPNRYADLLPRVRAAIADVENCVVLGWSFSGPLALMLAVEQPGRVSGVILAASFVRCPLPIPAWTRHFLCAPVAAAIRTTRRVPPLLLGRWTPAHRQAKMATWQRVPARTLAARGRAILGLNALPQLKACRQRILYLAGSADRIVPRRCADVIEEHGSSVSVVTIDGPHLALYSNPTDAAARIVAFMA